MARELPHSTEAEQAILGAMLVYPSVGTSRWIRICRRMSSTSMCIAASMAA